VRKVRLPKRARGRIGSGTRLSMIRKAAVKTRKTASPARASGPMRWPGLPTSRRPSIRETMLTTRQAAPA